MPKQLSEADVRRIFTEMLESAGPKMVRDELRFLFDEERQQLRVSDPPHPDDPDWLLKLREKEGKGIPPIGDNEDWPDKKK